MSDDTYITLREGPQLKDMAAKWFHSKWGVPQEAYLECMEAYLKNETEYGWYLCLSGNKIIGGLGVIENDFHDRKDLAPNVCAVYTEAEYRCKGIAGHLLNMVVEHYQSALLPPNPSHRINAGKFLRFETFWASKLFNWSTLSVETRQ